MSMIGNFLRVDISELNEYLKNSSLLEERVYSEGDVEDLNLLDVDKTWEGIFFLLTGYGSAELEDALPPLSWTLFSGQLIDEDQDMGYGPANYCTPEQVKEVSDALSKISIATLKEKYDPVRMDELGLYPFNWVDDKEGFEYLSEHYERMKEFYSIAAQNNQAVITFIN